MEAARTAFLQRFTLYTKRRGPQFVYYINWSNDKCELNGGIR
jgi:hypothetical protein